LNLLGTFIAGLVTDCMLLRLPCDLLQTQLQAHRFFGRPKLALDAVGGDSAGRIAEALEQVGPCC
jgi:hypothetical protein